MAFNFSYISIPLITVLVALLGSSFTDAKGEWYRTLRKPAWTPPGAVIGAVWTFIFICAAISALLVWNTFVRSGGFWFTISFFALNGITNVLWSYLFFRAHRLKAAVYVAAALELTVLVLLFLIEPVSDPAAALLIPYSLWVFFATYLTRLVWKMNYVPPPSWEVRRKWWR